MSSSRPSRLSARARFPGSTAPRAFGVCWRGQGFTPTHHAYSNSTTRSTSPETILRDPLEGTSHFRSRLAFYPYTRVRGTSCTSEPLRSSTALSNGFNLLRRRSNGFGLPVRGSVRSYHTVPDRASVGGSQGNGSQGKYPRRSIPAADFRFPCATAACAA